MSVKIAREMVRIMKGLELRMWRSRGGEEGVLGRWVGIVDYSDGDDIVGRKIVLKLFALAEKWWKAGWFRC
jgi:hypothetical protein